MRKKSSEEQRKDIQMKDRINERRHTEKAITQSDPDTPARAAKSERDGAECQTESRGVRPPP